MATDAPPDPTRRDFMRSVGALGAAVRLSAHVGALDSAAATRKGLDAGSGELPRRPQTDHLDLGQIHGIVYDNDPELAYAAGGVLEAFDQAKKQGKARFVGFTGHKDPAFHLKMLERGYPFDTVQMPLNPFDAGFHSFEKQVLPEVNRRGMAALGMKSMGGAPWAVKNRVASADELLRYAMSLPVATTICGMYSLDGLGPDLGHVRGVRPR